MTFRDKYDALEVEVCKAFIALVKDKDIIFLTDDMNLEDDIDELPNVDKINSNGDQYFVRVLSIVNGFLNVVEDENHTKTNTITFDDINDLYFAISLVEAIEYQLSK